MATYITQGSMNTAHSTKEALAGRVGEAIGKTVESHLGRYPETGDKFARVEDLDERTIDIRMNLDDQTGQILLILVTEEN